MIKVRIGLESVQEPPDSFLSKGLQGADQKITRLVVSGLGQTGRLNF